jgi:7-keto-8-aminopelargonate synthetase-like enzyme
MGGFVARKAVFSAIRVEQSLVVADDFSHALS